MGTFGFVLVCGVPRRGTPRPGRVPGANRAQTSHDGGLASLSFWLRRRHGAWRTNLWHGLDGNPAIAYIPHGIPPNSNRVTEVSDGTRNQRYGPGFRGPDH